MTLGGPLLLAEMIFPKPLEVVATSHGLPLDPGVMSHATFSSGPGSFVDFTSLGTSSFPHGRRTGTVYVCRWQAADDAYYASDERRAIDPDPARHLLHTEQWMMRPT